MNHYEIYYNDLTEQAHKRFVKAGLTLDGTLPIGVITCCVSDDDDDESEDDAPWDDEFEYDEGKIDF